MCAPSCINVCLCLYSCLCVPSSPPLSFSPKFLHLPVSLECILGPVCVWLGYWHCRPFESAEQSLGWGERAGLQLLLPLLQPHSPRGESSAGLLPSGCMNISCAGALSWPSTTVFAPPAWEGLPPLPGWASRGRGVVGRSRAGRGPHGGPAASPCLGSLGWVCGGEGGGGGGGQSRCREAASSQSEAHALNEVKLVF